MGMVVRKPIKGLGEAVAKRTFLRETKGELETWEDLARRVALGNSSLLKNGLNHDRASEEEKLRKYIAKGLLLMSGRHLQHGDESQPTRPMEIQTNCSTSATSSVLYYLLLNGSGVGRSYDDALMVVDYCKYAPEVVPVISETHPDFPVKCSETGRQFETVEEAKKRLDEVGKEYVVYHVEDSREGWAEAAMHLEVATWQRTLTNKAVIYEFSGVRERGAPIHGMQGRPASGPEQPMVAFKQINEIRLHNWPIWKQQLFVDHYLAACVVFGGARRSARWAGKYWKDPGIFEFIKIKREHSLWTANNSVAVDEEFWEYVKMNPKDCPENEKEVFKWAQRVFDSICHENWEYGAGEPGFVNVDKLKHDNTGLEELLEKDFLNPDHKFKATSGLQDLTRVLLQKALNHVYQMIVNPCGEKAINLIGGYCVIGDLAYYHADSLEEILDALKATTRALIRTNTMKALYEEEVKRTNRIGVSITGIHEFAYKFFGLTFRDLIDEEKSKDFWVFLGVCNKVVRKEAIRYSKLLGLNVPHTALTIKPSGSVSKLYGLSEGAHLPAMRQYLRWVQFNSDNSLVKEYEQEGYPTKVLTKQHKTIVVGFPTEPEICNVIPREDIVLASEATPEEQFKYLSLLEKHYIDGEESEELGSHLGSQISYTLKYRKEEMDFEGYKEMLKNGLVKVKCVSVMPQGDPEETRKAYEYLPEEPVTFEKYKKVLDKVTGNMVQDIGREHLECEGGACPIVFKDA